MDPAAQSPVAVLDTRRSLGLVQPSKDCSDSPIRIRFRWDIQLVVDVPDVDLNRLDADEHLLGYAAVAQPLRHPLQRLLFEISERRCPSCYGLLPEIAFNQKWVDGAFAFAYSFQRLQ